MIIYQYFFHACSYAVEDEVFHDERSPSPPPPVLHKSLTSSPPSASSSASEPPAGKNSSRQTRKRQRQTAAGGLDPLDIAMIESLNKVKAKCAKSHEEDESGLFGVQVGATLRCPSQHQQTVAKLKIQHF